MNKQKPNFHNELGGPYIARMGAKIIIAVSFSFKWGRFRQSLSQLFHFCLNQYPSPPTPTIPFSIEYRILHSSQALNRVGIDGHRTWDGERTELKRMALVCGQMVCYLSKRWHTTWMGAHLLLLCVRIRAAFLVLTPT